MGMYPPYRGFRWWLEWYAYRRPEWVDWSEAWPVQKPAIFASPHPGTMDPGILAARIRRDLGEPAFFVAMHKVGKVFGPYITHKLFWIILINENDRQGCLPQILEVLRRGYRLAIFPGGKLDHGKPLTVEMARKGLAIIAHRSGAPVYPIGYYGPTNQNKKEFVSAVFGDYPVRIKVGKPLFFPKITSRIHKTTILETTEIVINQINALVDDIRD